MNVLGLFSGIGGFELGFERAGFNIAAMCEIEPYCRAVLRKHWPTVPVFSDIRELTGASVVHLGIDVITGGFPCQDISLAGKGAGIGGERSGLWREMHRVISEVRPRWVVVENVSALRSRGLDAVLGSLAAIGYDAEWHCIPASAVGAPHRRDRIWVIAYPQADTSRSHPHGVGLHREAQHQQGSSEFRDQQIGVARPLGEALADANGARRSQPERPGETLFGAGAGQLAGPDGSRWDQWLVEPDVGRVANGVPARVDRLRALGNAVIPQIPEMIARAIITKS